jgi:hypothetical protein
LRLDLRQHSMRVVIRRDIRLRKLAIDDLREHAGIVIILDPAFDRFNHDRNLHSSDENRNNGCHWMAVLPVTKMWISRRP